MKVTFNDDEYNGLAGLLIYFFVVLSITLMTLLFVGFIFLMIALIICSPLILIGFLIWLL